MFPNVDGFHWTAWHIGFLVAFFCVAATIAATVALALWRSWRVRAARRVESIRWRQEFHDLPESARACRYALTGALPGRVCDRAFACSGCPIHTQQVKLGPPACAGDEHPFGLSYPADRFYHRGHTWLHAEKDGTFTVGLDALGERLAGMPDSVEMPAVGAKVSANGHGWTMCRNGTAVRVLSPVAGVAVETGGPQAGFYLRVKPVNGRVDLGSLLTPSEVSPWLQREIERLQLMMAPGGEALSLADGGIPVEDLPAACPTADWDAVWGGMFLEP